MPGGPGSLGKPSAKDWRRAWARDQLAWVDLIRVGLEEILAWVSLKAEGLPHGDPSRKPVPSGLDTLSPSSVRLTHVDAKDPVAYWVNLFGQIVGVEGLGEVMG